MSARLARRCLAPALLSLLSLASPRALAEPADARARATALFDAAALAYEGGQYLAAAEAFQKANELLPSPSFVFSAAQAYRREYLARSAPEPLRRAVALYRAYLAADPKGRRHAEAMAALEALVPLEARLPSPDPAAPPPAPSAPAGTRLLLTAKPDGAEVSVDGGSFVATPVVVKVTVGPHALRFRAPGCQDEVVSVTALEGELVPGTATLRERTAELRIAGADGARVLVDGKVEGDAPGPLAVGAGDHVVTLTLRGHEPQVTSVKLLPDEHRALTIRLAPTRQRFAALAVLSVGTVGATLAGSLGVAALVREGEAATLWERRAAQGLTAAERDRYNTALADRNALGLASGLAAGLSAATLALGAGLFVLDEPSAPARPQAPSARLVVGPLSLSVWGSF